jgi:hypothetical protein
MGRHPLVTGLSVCGLALTFGLFAVAQSPPTSAQIADQTPGIPKFRVESRQVLVQANVWNPGVKKHATNLLSKPGQQIPKGWPTPAGGLTAKDFHAFDNGVEQRINFLKELDLTLAGRTRGGWNLIPTELGEPTIRGRTGERMPLQHI